MRYPQYDANGKLLGHYANAQFDRAGKLYTAPPIPDDHPDILAWVEARKRAVKPGKTLAERVTAIEDFLKIPKA